MSGPKTTNWDAIVTSAPMDKQAAIVRDGRSSGEPIKVVNAYTAQPPTRPYAFLPENDLTGQRFGRVVALGLGEKGGNGTPWVVRCDCGRFARMRHRVLKGPKRDRQLQCGECDYIDRMKAGLVEDRAVLRYEKPTSTGEVEAEVAAEPWLSECFAQLTQHGIAAELILRAMSRFIQREQLKLRKPTP